MKELCIRLSQNGQSMPFSVILLQNSISSSPSIKGPFSEHVVHVLIDHYTQESEENDLLPVTSTKYNRKNLLQNSEMAEGNKQISDSRTFEFRARPLANIIYKSHFYVLSNICFQFL